MCRAYTTDAVDPALVDRLLDRGRRAPAAGNTDGREFLVLEGAVQTSRYWDVTLPSDRRASFRWPRLLDAPVLVVLLVRPEAWVERYAEDDKQRSGLGDSTTAWSVPYWWVDAGMAAESIMDGAAEAGLGSLFFGLFDHEPAVLETFNVPDGWRAAGTIALGWPAGDDERGRSAGRARRPIGELVHREHW